MIFEAERKNNMINIDGVELSEDTVRNALKKAGISLEKKHEWKAGDMAFLDGDFRLIGCTNYRWFSLCQNGNTRTHNKPNTNHFDNFEYKYIGRFEDMVKEYMNNHPELKG